MYTHDTHNLSCHINAKSAEANVATCLRIHTHIHTFTQLYIDTSIHTYIYTRHMHNPSCHINVKPAEANVATCLRMHIHLYVCIYICMFVYICIDTHTHIHTCIYTHMRRYNICMCTHRMYHLSAHANEISCGDCRDMLANTRISIWTIYVTQHASHITSDQNGSSWSVCHHMHAVTYIHI